MSDEEKDEKDTGEGAVPTRPRIARIVIDFDLESQRLSVATPDPHVVGAIVVLGLFEAARSMYLDKMKERNSRVVRPNIQVMGPNGQPVKLM